MADEELLLALLAALIGGLQLASAALYLSRRAQTAPWLAAAVPTVFLGVAGLKIRQAGSSGRLTSVETTILAFECLILVFCLAKALAHMPTWLFWAAWCANLATLALVIYLAFFFRVF